jgi:hypothetical protein
MVLSRFGGISRIMSGTQLDLNFGNSRRDLAKTFRRDHVGWRCRAPRFAR